MIYDLRIMPHGPKVILTATLLSTFAFLAPGFANARITPEDIMNSRKEAYLAKVANYSPEHKQNLVKLNNKIAALNKEKTDYLSWIMDGQARILDEYEHRFPGKNEQSSSSNKEGVEKARYWITFAHEAVAYQAAKIYIFNLTSEGNIKNDALSTIGLFSSELEATRGKVVYSQEILEQVLRINSAAGG